MGIQTLEKGIPSVLRSGKLLNIPGLFLQDYTCIGLATHMSGESIAALVSWVQPDSIAMLRYGLGGGVMQSFGRRVYKIKISRIESPM